MIRVAAEVEMMVEHDWELAQEERLLANHRSSLKDGKELNSLC